MTTKPSTKYPAQSAARSPIFGVSATAQPPVTGNSILEAPITDTPNYGSVSGGTLTLVRPVTTHEDIVSFWQGVIDVGQIYNGQLSSDISDPSNPLGEGFVFLGVDTNLTEAQIAETKQALYSVLLNNNNSLTNFPENAIFSGARLITYGGGGTWGDFEYITSGSNLQPNFIGSGSISSNFLDASPIDFTFNNDSQSPLISFTRAGAAQGDITLPTGKKWLFAFINNDNSQALDFSMTLAIQETQAAFTPAALFTNGEDGDCWDFLSTNGLYQDEAKQFPVTGVGQVIRAAEGDFGNITLSTPSNTAILRNTGIGLVSTGLNAILESAITAHSGDFTIFIRGEMDERGQIRGRTGVANLDLNGEGSALSNNRVIVFGTSINYQLSNAEEAEPQTIFSLVRAGNELRLYVFGDLKQTLTLSTVDAVTLVGLGINTVNAVAEAVYVSKYVYVERATTDQEQADLATWAAS